MARRKCLARELREATFKLDHSLSSGWCEVSPPRLSNNGLMMRGSVPPQFSVKFCKKEEITADFLHFEPHMK